jgi:hypothetical protein
MEAVGRGLGSLPCAGVALHPLFPPQNTLPVFSTECRGPREYGKAHLFAVEMRQRERAGGGAGPRGLVRPRLRGRHRPRVLAGQRPPLAGRRAGWVCWPAGRQRRRLGWRAGGPAGLLADSALGRSGGTRSCSACQVLNSARGARRKMLGRALPRHAYTAASCRQPVGTTVQGGNCGNLWRCSG